MWRDYGFTDAYQMFTLLNVQGGIRVTIGGGVAAHSGGNGLVLTASKTANYNAAQEDLVLCNTSGGAFTVTLPAAPDDGDRIGILLSVAGNNLTFARNGKNIDGAASDLTISAAGTMRVLQYDGTQWLTVGAAGESALGSTYSITASASYEDTGLSVALPKAGTYLIGYNARVTMQFSGGAGSLAFIVVELYDATGAAAITNSERFVMLVNSSNVLNAQGESAYTALVTVTQPITLKLYAKRDATGVPVWTTSDVSTDSNGRTTLNYTKVA